MIVARNGYFASIASSSLIVERIDAFDLDHRGLAGFEIERAVNVEPLPTRGLPDGQRLSAGPQQPTDRAA